MEFQTKQIKVGKNEVTIRELSMEQESLCKGNSLEFDRVSKLPRTNHAKLNAELICASVVPETWPKEWGELTVENVSKLPARFTRMTLYEINRLNSNMEDVETFLASRPHSDRKKTQSSTRLRSVSTSKPSE